jgi:hypothetical protein
VLKVRKEIEVRKGFQDHRALRDCKDPPVLKVRKEIEVRKGFQDHRALRVQLVRKDRKVYWMKQLCFL